MATPQVDELVKNMIAAFSHCQSRVRSSICLKLSGIRFTEFNKAEEEEGFRGFQEGYGIQLLITDLGNGFSKVQFQIGQGYAADIRP